ncbi:MAG: hypothetical protein AAGL49_07620 [Pseudomonadota bacterium]
MLPLLALPMLVYAIVAIVRDASVFEQNLYTVNMMSGDLWAISIGDMFVIVSLMLLFIEILRATQTHASSIINHALSMVVFIAAILLFVMMPGFGSSTFFIFTMMTLLDVMAGFIVTIVSARRDFGVAEGAFGASG